LASCDPVLATVPDMVERSLHLKNMGY